MRTHRNLAKYKFPRKALGVDISQGFKGVKPLIGSRLQTIDH